MATKADLKDTHCSKAKATGKRYEIFDTRVPAFGIRVSPKGAVTFIIFTRFPGGKSPTRVTLGSYPAMALAHARRKADDWKDKIKAGTDPRLEEEQERKALERKRVNTWRAVVDDYIADMPNRKRNRHIEQDEREIRRELLERKDRKTGKVTWSNPWADKPVADITDSDIAELIAAIRDRPAPGMAYVALGHAKAIFGWAMWPERRSGYDLADDPTRNIKPKHVGLASKQDRARVRVFGDQEIRAFWKAADTTPYPLGPFYKLLMLTGQRKSEVSDARWPEFDLTRNVWTVPPERFKSGQSHIVPLSSDAVTLLNSLDRFEGETAGDCLFSTTGGQKPINGFSRAKSALDTAMLAALRKDDPDATLAPWTFHDVRRTVRTRLSALKVNRDVAELVIGHGKKGLDRVYDHHEFEPEMREALEKWAIALRGIVNPTPTGNVTRLDDHRATA
ncbi:phage integrase family protein [Nitratireductor indicus C115]|uniref:Phage integrase family protein n=1 Tax=Nitratireductor indicus C115 TaxID=1231190 RepID=K2PR18_9HYPH|nr:site-specific integrase [Nitratireductor indicus]EKF43477.1 phage integrase family protein [Nitratireductor indicus C115]SFQ06780.1 Integrase [Nitratireductor indicus]